MGTIRDAVTEGNDGGALVTCFYVDALEEGPVVDFLWRFECFGADDMAFYGVTRLVGKAVLRNLLDRLSREEEADSDVSESRKLEVSWVADTHGPRWDSGGRQAAESEDVGGRGFDLTVAGAESDVGSSNGQRFEAELVAENDANRGAADGDVDDLTKGSIHTA